MAHKNSLGVQQTSLEFCSVLKVYQNKILSSEHTQVQGGGGGGGLLAHWSVMTMMIIPLPHYHKKKIGGGIWIQK